VIHHTDCGMALFTDTIIRDLLAHSLETAVVDEKGWRDVGAGPGSDAGEFIDWLTFLDPASAVVTDVRRIRNHPLVPNRIPIYGFVYDVKTGNSSRFPKRLRLVQRRVKVVASRASLRAALRSSSSRRVEWRRLCRQTSDYYPEGNIEGCPSGTVTLTAVREIDSTSSRLSRTRTRTKCRRVEYRRFAHPSGPATLAKISATRVSNFPM
jgi:hypothetical protein